MQKCRRSIPEWSNTAGNRSLPTSVPWNMRATSARASAWAAACAGTAVATAASRGAGRGAFTLRSRLLAGRGGGAAAVQCDVVPRCRILQRLEVREHAGVGDRVADVGLDLLEQLVAALHAPVAGHEHVQ